MAIFGFHSHFSMSKISRIFHWRTFISDTDFWHRKMTKYGNQKCATFIFLLIVKIHTVWSVNDGLSGNPQETSENRPRWFPEIFTNIFFFQKHVLMKTSGNRRGRFPEVSKVPRGFRGFPENPSLTDRTVVTSSCATTGLYLIWFLWPLQWRPSSLTSRTLKSPSPKTRLSTLNRTVHIATSFTLPRRPVT